MPEIKLPVHNIIRNNMMNYGAYIIGHRALPDYRDGMKPGARRIITTMYNSKATRFTKSADIVGSVMKIHPHGSTYGTLADMAQEDRYLHPYVIGEGNFGQFTSKNMPAAADRYTEVKLSDLSIDFLSQLSKNVVNFVPNFDGSKMIPEVLPVKFPTILTTAQSGIAYGMASNTLSFNLSEIVDAMVKYVKEGTKQILVPDFATGGYIVYNPEAFKKINLEGTGSIHIRGKAEIVGNDIIVTEIPYNVKREDIIDKIAELAKVKKLEVSAVKDLTGLNGMKIKIKAKRGADMNVLLEKLYQLTNLQSSISSNSNVLFNGRPKVMGVWEIIDEWIKWRKETIIRGLNFDIEKMEKQLHFFRGLEKVLVDIDKAIEIIRYSSEDEIIPNLCKEFVIDETQAEDVANMKLRNINKSFILRKIAGIDKLEEDINKLKDITNNEDNLNKYFINELNEVKSKYGKDRKSKVIKVNMEKVKAVKKKIEAVPNYPVKLFVTKQGYVKKFNYNALLEDQYIKPGDEIVETYESMNHAELLVFGSDCNCYKIKMSDIEETTNKGLGVFIPSLCDVKEIVGTSVLDEVHKFIIIAYDNNKIAKIDLKSFNGNRKKLANSLSNTDKVVGILTYKDEGKFIFKTTTSAFKIPTVNFELKERWTKGTYGPRKGVATEVRYDR